MNRQQQLDLIYRKTHSDFKGIIDGRKTMLVYRNGTCLVYLDDLTDKEIADRLPKNIKH